MSAANDKARQNLERSIPDLKEFERKKIFTKPEIASIVKSRSEFEMATNTAGSKSDVYKRYIQYERNLEQLRRKRVARLGIRNSGPSAHSSQKRLFSLFDRATRKFSGDVELWLQYVDFCRQVDARKKIDQVFTKLLRLHPTKPALWIVAAQYEFRDNGSVTAARQYLQRGIRFCEHDWKIWIEYARLEMAFIAKLEARQEVFRLFREVARAEKEENGFEGNADSISLPLLAQAETEQESDEESDEDGNVVPKKKEMPNFTEDELDKLKKGGILEGAIPKTVFDEAMEKFKSDVELAEKFVDLFLLFSETRCALDVAKHALSHMSALQPASFRTKLSQARLELAQVQPTNSEHPVKLLHFFSTVAAIEKEAGSLASRIGVLDKAARTVGQFLKGAEQGDSLLIREEVRQIVVSKLRQWLGTVIEYENNQNPGTRNEQRLKTATEKLEALQEAEAKKKSAEISFDE